MAHGERKENFFCESNDFFWEKMTHFLWVMVEEFGDPMGVRCLWAFHHHFLLYTY